MKTLVIALLLSSTCNSVGRAKPVLHLWLMSEARGTVLLPLPFASQDYPSEEQRVDAHRIIRKVCLDAGWKDGAFYIGFEGLSNYKLLKEREYQWSFHCGWPGEWQTVPEKLIPPNRDLR